MVVYFNDALFAPFSHKRGLGAGEGFKEGGGAAVLRRNPPPPPPPPPPTTTKAPDCVDPGENVESNMKPKCCVDGKVYVPDNGKTIDKNVGGGVTRKVICKEWSGRGGPPGRYLYYT